MLKSIYIVCLLLSNCHSSQQAKDDSKENEKVQDDSIEEKDLSRLPCSRPMLKPTMDSPSSEATIGRNVTLECVSQNHSPPINYTLYMGDRKIQPTAIKYKAGEKAVFHFVISSDQELGVYKCKVQNKCRNATQYTHGFNFTLRVSNSNNVIPLIVSPLLLLIMAAVTISLLILWCRARKSKPSTAHAGSVPTTYPASENCATYEKIAYENEDVRYADIKFNTKEEDYINVIVEEDPTVNYAEVVIRK